MRIGVGPRSQQARNHRRTAGDGGSQRWGRDARSRSPRCWTARPRRWRRAALGSVPAQYEPSGPSHHTSHRVYRLRYVRVFWFGCPEVQGLLKKPVVPEFRAQFRARFRIGEPSEVWAVAIWPPVWYPWKGSNTTRSAGEFGDRRESSLRCRPRVPVCVGADFAGLSRTPGSPSRNRLSLFQGRGKA